MHPVAHVTMNEYNNPSFATMEGLLYSFINHYQFTNTLIKTTVRNKYLFVLDFNVHYYMFRPRSVAIFR
jgi:hypothetical protein